MTASSWLKATTAGVLLAAAFLLISVMRHPAKPTLQFDGQQHQSLAFNEPGPTKCRAFLL